MQREKEAFKLYSDLAESVEDENSKNLLIVFVQEETTQKLGMSVSGRVSPCFISC